MKIFITQKLCTLLACVSILIPLLPVSANADTDESLRVSNTLQTSFSEHPKFTFSDLTQLIDRAQVQDLLNFCRFYRKTIDATTPTFMSRMDFSQHPLYFRES